MAKFTNSLDNIRIAAPCSADWDRMFAFQGERVRFCSECNLNVYNLSGMTRTEAEDLLNQTEGRVCVRLYRRADGTVLTEDCPVGLKAVNRRVALMLQALVGVMLSLLSGLALYKSTALASFLGGRVIHEPYQREMGAIAPNPEETDTMEPPKIKK